MKVNPKVELIRKIQKIKRYFDEQIEEEKLRIADAKLDYRFNIECGQTPLMQRVYALCYRDTFRRGNKMIEYWHKRFLEEKKKILTEV